MPKFVLIHSSIIFFPHFLHTKSPNELSSSDPHMDAVDDDILDENTGHIVQSNNLLKYSNTVDYLMDHKTILDEMAKNGMRSARSKFSLNVIYSHWKDLFDRFEKINADGEFNC